MAEWNDDREPLKDAPRLNMDAATLKHIRDRINRHEDAIGRAIMAAVNAVSVMGLSVDDVVIETHKQQTMERDILVIGKVQIIVRI